MYVCILNKKKQYILPSFSIKTKYVHMIYSSKYDKSGILINLFLYSFNQTLFSFFKK